MPEVWMYTKQAWKLFYRDSKGDCKLWNTGHNKADDQ